VLLLFAALSSDVCCGLDAMERVDAAAPPPFQAGSYGGCTSCLGQSQPAPNIRAMAERNSVGRSMDGRHPSAACIVAVAGVAGCHCKLA
jgi:hypothetical protein